MNLNAVMPINRTSYGVVSYYILKYLKEAGVHVSLFPVGPVDISSFADQGFDFLEEFGQNASSFKYDAPCLKIFHQNLLGEFVGRGKHVAYSFFEIDPLTERDVHHINSVDKFISPSNWAKKVCENSGVTVPISIAAPSVELSLITNDNKPSGETIKFLHIGKWEERKCHKEMIEAFGEAFDPFDDVQLDLVCYNPFCNDEEHTKWFDVVRSSKNGHKINVLNPLQLHSQILNLYNDYHVYVSLSRAEGYDLPLIEAMSNGLLCVGTNSAAHKDYLTDDNCILVQPSGREKAFDGKWFLGESEWDKFDTEDFVGAFVKAKEEIEKGCSEKVEAAKQTALGNSWEKTVEKIIGELE